MKKSPEVEMREDLVRFVSVRSNRPRVVTELKQPEIKSLSRLLSVIQSTKILIGGLPLGGSPADRSRLTRGKSEEGGCFLLGRLKPVIPE